MLVQDNSPINVVTIILMKLKSSMQQIFIYSENQQSNDTEHVPTNAILHSSIAKYSYIQLHLR